MQTRHQQLLERVVREYIKSAEPVSSGLLVNKYKFKVSSATVRNDLVELEEAGYLRQPHTSAGRVPTESAYRYYLDHCFKQAKINHHAAEILLAIVSQTSPVSVPMIKEIAKALAAFTRQSAIVAFSPTDVYCTGFSYLFSQPEFTRPEMVYDFSAILDQIEQGVDKIFSDIKEQASIFLGETNPFNRQCGAVMVKYVTPTSVDR